MKRVNQFNLPVIAISFILASCGCNSERGSDFFSKVDPVRGDLNEVILSGGSGGGQSGGADSGGNLTSGGAASSGGASSSGGAASSGGASSSGGTASSGGASSGGGVVINPPPPPSEKDMCEVIKEDGEDILYGYGLAGKIYDGAPDKIQNFNELLAKGKVLEGTVFMSKLNIPTKKFEKGFPREDGTMLMNSMGQLLIENFGIEFTGELQLSEGDEEGYYEIGIIADDGVTLDIPKQEGDKNLISGDHQTSTKFFCSKQLVRMEKNRSVPIRLRWFQGPRYHLALIVMWRKVEPLSLSNDPLAKSALKNPVKETRCGIAGNKFFFDPDSESHPQMEYLDLFDKTKRAVPWSIIKHKNYKLPAGYSNMECVSKTP